MAQQNNRPGNGEQNGKPPKPARGGEPVTPQGLAEQLEAARKENADLKAEMAKLEPQAPVIVFRAPWVRPGNGDEEKPGKATKTEAVATASVSGMILGFPHLIIGEIKLARVKETNQLTVYMPASGASYASRRHIGPRKMVKTLFDGDGHEVTTQEVDDPLGAKENERFCTAVIDAWKSFGKMAMEQRWGVERELGI